jgi:hypothetical protein
MKTEDRNTLKILLKSHGWEEDSYGNLKKVIKNSQKGDRMYRYKFNDRVIRFEVKCVDRWIRVYSIKSADLPRVIEKLKNGKQYA